MFRRRRSADAGPGWAADTDAGLPEDELEDDESSDDEPAGPVGPLRAEGGPWDVKEAHPARDRVDFGSLLVPRGPGYDIVLDMAGAQGVWLKVRDGQSEMWVQAFAAARSSALWDDIRAEIAGLMRDAGGRTEESAGWFGPELVAEVPTVPNQPESGLRQVRFVGVDGPRWFVRVMFDGPAAAGGEPAAALEDVLRDIVVVRGEHAVPPGQMLDLRPPPEVRQAFEAQAEEENRFRMDLNPFDRGPEFTETR